MIIKTDNINFTNTAHVKLKKPDWRTNKTEFLIDDVLDVVIRDGMIIFVDYTDYGMMFHLDDIETVTYGICKDEESKRLYKLRKLRENRLESANKTPNKNSSENEILGYEVVFVIYGFVGGEDDIDTNPDEYNLGHVKCNGLIPDGDGSYTIKDGRLSYFTFAKSPEEAYTICRKYLLDEDLKDICLFDCVLEHVYSEEADEYWYLSDLNLKLVHKCL